MELEAELVWASGPLLEENETLAGQVAHLTKSNDELKEQLDLATQRLRMAVPAAGVALAMAVVFGWFWSRSE